MRASAFPRAQALKSQSAHTSQERRKRRALDRLQAENEKLRCVVVELCIENSLLRRTDRRARSVLGLHADELTKRALRRLFRG